MIWAVWAIDIKSRGGSEQDSTRHKAGLLALTARNNVPAIGADLPGFEKYPGSSLHMRANRRLASTCLCIFSNSPMT
jgi:hypothetical protein